MNKAKARSSGILRLLFTAVLAAATWAPFPGEHTRRAAGSQANGSEYAVRPVLGHAILGYPNPRDPGTIQAFSAEGGTAERRSQDHAASSRGTFPLSRRDSGIRQQADRPARQESSEAQADQSR